MTYLPSCDQPYPRTLRMVSAEMGIASSNGSSLPFDPDVEFAFVGLEKRDVRPVGRDLSSGDLGIAEEYLAVDDRGQLVEIIELLRYRAGCHQGDEGQCE